MNPTLPRSPLVDRCKNDVIAQSASMIDRCVFKARLDLQELSRGTASSELGRKFVRAEDALKKATRALRQAYLRILAERIEKLMHGVDPDRPPPADGSEGEKPALALVDDVEVARFVETSRLQQAVLPVVGKSQAQLDSLVSSAFGLAVVRADLNPFQPQVFCDALLQAIDTLELPAEVRSDWLRVLRTPYAEEINRLYEQLIELLQRQGIEEARYQVKLSEGTTRRAPGTSRGGGELGPDALDGDGDGGTADDSRPPSIRGQLVEASARSSTPVPSMEQLSRRETAIAFAAMRDFLYRPGWIDAFDEPLSAGYFAAVRAEAARLDEVPDATWDASAHAQAMQARQAQSAVDRQPLEVDAEGALEPARWGVYGSPQARTRLLMELKSRVAKMSQAFGLDAVRTLIRQVASDKRLLAPVREAFVALEPALLRVAVDDPQFFGDESHPARRFVESTAQRSFKYNDEFSPEFQSFIEPVCDAVRALAALPEVGPADFEQRHKLLEARWQQEDRVHGEERERVVQSMQFAQERQALADRIARDLSLRPDLVGAPKRVVTFLYKEWSLVIAHAQLAHADNQLDPGGYLAIVSDLLWSVNRKQALEDPRRLFDLIPHLIKTLQGGLVMIGKDAAETRPFFDALMRYHAPVLRLRRHRSALETGAVPLETEFHEMLDRPLDEPLTPEETQQPWIASGDRETVGYDEAAEAEVEAAVAEEPVDVTGEPVAPSAPGALDVHGWAPPPPATVGGAPRREEESALAQAIVSGLRANDWVDLHVRGAWARAQLIWISDNGALFMFVGDDGAAHSMTRRRCEKLVAQRQLRALEAERVIDHALRELSSAEVEPV